MTAEYPGKVTLREVIAGSLLLVLGVAGVVALAVWLRPTSPEPPPLPAPGAPPEGEPGALVCPPGQAVGTVEVDASQLIDCPEHFDGGVVSYRGEVIGAVFTRDGRPVVVLNDDPYALGPGPVPQTRTALGGNSGLTVRLPAGFDDEITHVGSYAARGDVVAVVGRFEAVSAALGGEPAIDAARAAVVRRGGPIDHEVEVRTVVVAVAALVAAAVLAVLSRVLPREGRTSPPWR